MLVHIAFLFSALVPEHGKITFPEHHQVFSSPATCSITNIAFDNIGECNDNGTANVFDDYFTADVLVEFIDPPTTGQLRIELGEDAMTGGGPLSVEVFDILDPGMYVFEGVRLKADGTLSEVPVSFSALPGCREVTTDGPAVASCSVCDISNASIINKSACNNNGTADPADDFYTADVAVNFTNPPATGDLRLEPGGDLLPGGGATSIPVGSLASNSHTFTGVRFKADGAITVIEVEFTADNSCVRTTSSTGVNSCSGGLACAIDNVSIINKSACNNNGTADPADDFYTADVAVNFTNPPATGDLRLEPGGDLLPGGGATSIPVGSLASNSHTFTGVRFKADGAITVIEVEFTADNSCVRTTSSTGVNSCSGGLACAIDNVSIINKSACNNNGTADPADDFYTADVAVNFTNPPATGDLRLEPGGDLLPGGGATSIPVGSLASNSHTFTGVRFKADGAITVIEVEFTADNSCVRTTSSTGVNSCCDLTITNAIPTPENCPNANDGSITVTATTSAGPLTYAISGPVSQSNSTGVFAGLPDGNYTILVTDNGTGNCTATASVTVAAGIDQTPPVAVCKNTIVTLDATGNYTLTSDDVFDQGASSDNCGVVNLIGKSLESVTCAQLGQTIPVTVNVNDGNGNTSSCIAQITVQQGAALPAGFTGENIGNANGANTFESCSAGKFTLTASGFSTSSSDVQRFVSRQLCGSGEIIAHVASVSGGGWAGITLRETTAPGSKKVALKTQFSNNIRREIRTATNGAVNSLNFFRPQDTWLRLVRSGNNFSGYTSLDGMNWNFAFSTTVAMSGCIRVGLFSESTNVNTTTTAVFDQVTVTGAAVPLVAPGAGQVAYEMPDFQVYPNPTTGEVRLDLSAFTSHTVHLEVRNAQGQLQQTLELNPLSNTSEKLDFSTFLPGIYTIVAKSSGWPVVAKRVVLMSKY